MTNRRMTTQTKVFGGLLAAILLAAIGYQAGAVRALLAEPTAVATVNLSKVLEGLEERGQAERDLEAMRERFRAQDEQKQADLKSLEQQLQDIVDPAKLKEARENLELKQLEYLAWRQVKADQIDVERAVRLQNLYRKITAAIAEQAAAEGYDLVLVDDSSSDFTINPEARISREEQVRQQIIGRRMLYGTETIDLTEPLIVRMNNAFRAGQPG